MLTYTTHRTKSPFIRFKTIKILSSTLDWFVLPEQDSSGGLILGDLPHKCVVFSFSCAGCSFVFRFDYPFCT